MGKLSLNGKDLRKIGYPESKVIGIAIQVMHQYYKHSNEAEAIDILKDVLAAPDAYLEDAALGKIAAALLDEIRPKNDVIPLEQKRKEYAIYGFENIEMGAINQMEIAMKLPVTVAGALMPDAHQGYGLPIGGVLATNNAVIPYGVGVDIGCRMCLSVFDLPGDFVNDNIEKLKGFLTRNTVFGSGGTIKNPMVDAVLERKEFSENKLLKSLHDRAFKQIGTSGSGNHFVEFGIVEIKEVNNALGLAVGNYIGLLSHSGSRGLGATVANHYTKLAMQNCKLPNEAKYLAWLSLDTQEGMEYWLAMNLAGDYASACHHVIHDKIARVLNEEPLCRVENHHNFAWKEIHNGQELIVHRKGATPAGKNVLGIIPGSMTAPGYIVSGKGLEASLNSAAHGAGRRMSRSKALSSITMNDMKKLLKDHGVTLLGGGLDEAPQAYKDITKVMQAQTDLVDIVGVFYPKIVKMDQ